ncbi:MAG: Erythromycin esterase [Edaphobacter sp.]|nr:Erythromycin esterase [Edaphobacter sp.]
MFRDRKHAGELLAEQLTQYLGQPQTLLLALPRGGVPVAAALARALALPLDIFLVHKLSAPGEPELAMGAVAAGGLVVLHQEIIDSGKITQAAIDSAIACEQEELLRRERAYRGTRPPLLVTGKTIILVDDGLATGYTMLAAVRSAHQQQPARIVVAVPVASQEALDMLRPEADELVCAYMPRKLAAIGQFYDDFSQTTDDEVCQALRQFEPSDATPPA